MQRLITIWLWLLLLEGGNACAQLQMDNWVYNTSSSTLSDTFLHYINFNKATLPVEVKHRLDSIVMFSSLSSSAVTYSDKEGDLLFYSDGLYVYDRTFNKMPGSVNTANTRALKGTEATGFLPTQSSICIPYPGQDSLYILFHIHTLFQVPLSWTYKLYYSIVDMRMRNGLGDVDISMRNISLLGGAQVGLKLTGVQHCNKRDVWLIGHLLNSDKYYSLLITPSGVSAPVYFSGNNIGSFIHPLTGHDMNVLGCIKASPSGSKIAAAFTGADFVEVFDFNTTTGLGTNLKKLHIPHPAGETYPTRNTSFVSGIWGVGFSPSGQRLYTTSNYWPDVGYSLIHQYNTDLPDEYAIQNSMHRLDTFYTDSVNQGRNLGAIQMANDGKMYINTAYGLCVINSPEDLGNACGYVRLPRLSYSVEYNYNLPQFVESYLRYPLQVNTNCVSKNVNFSVPNLNGVSSVEWNFGDLASGANNISSALSPSHTFSSDGIYRVTAVFQNANGCNADTVIKMVNAGQLKIELGNDTSFCKRDSLILNPHIAGATMLWNTGSTDSNVIIKHPGIYSVQIRYAECTAADTIEITERNLPAFTLGADTIICSGSQISLTPQPVYPGVQYTWNTGSSNPSINADTAGSYWLRLTDPGGCNWNDTVNVNFKTLPGFTLGTDTSICKKDTIVLTATVNNANYLWNDNSVFSQIEVYQQGWYWCDVTKDGCTYRDSIQLTIKPLPVVNLGNDTTLCEGQQIQLHALNNNSNYLWQDNSNNEDYLVFAAGQYNVQVMKDGCENGDTINVAYKLKPHINLGGNQLLCNGQTVVLKPTIESSWQLVWQDGNNSSTYTVSQPGLYYLNATNECGTSRSEIIFTQGLCKVYIPNAFSPNGDNKNDLFRVSGTDLMNFFHMQIFNRYGQTVFETTDKNQPWNGLVKGYPADLGTYIYKLKYTDINSGQLKFLKGSFVLIR